MQIVKKAATLFWLLLIAPLTAVAQNQDVALIAVECVAVKGLCEQQNLIRFRFRNGVLVSQDVILKSKSVRFDLGNNQIYRNRYVINRWADIVDIQNKKVLHEGDGETVATEGDRIIQRINKSHTEGYFYYDLKTKRYGRLPKLTKWELPGLLSPDQTKSLMGHNDSIWLHRLGQPKKLLRVGVFNASRDIRVLFRATSRFLARVWSSLSNSWTTINPKWITHVIGWVRE